jgi:hypothetical protein
MEYTLLQDGDEFDLDIQIHPVYDVLLAPAGKGMVPADTDPPAPNDDMSWFMHCTCC